MLKRTRRTFITSDTHFGHSNIIKYCGRPYHVEGGNKNPANVPEVQRMNEDILKAFDELPESCDIWHLGDFWFSGGNPRDFANDDTICDLIQTVTRIRSKGRRIFLVLGNHDLGRLNNRSRYEYYNDMAFDKVYDSPVILEDKWILSHEPVWIEPGSHFVNLYGHTHDLVIPEDYFCFDQENYARDLREGMTPEMKWPDRKVDLKNYKNMCLDHSKGILEWKGDEFDVVRKIW
jgi:calcineurin-like phosphoesterase family protein